MDFNGKTGDPLEWAQYIKLTTTHLGVKTECRLKFDSPITSVVEFFPIEAANKIHFYIFSQLGWI